MQPTFDFVVEFQVYAFTEYIYVIEHGTILLKTRSIFLQCVRLKLSFLFNLQVESPSGFV